MPVGEQEVHASARVEAVELVDVALRVARPDAFADVAEDHPGAGLGRVAADVVVVGREHDGVGHRADPGRLAEPVRSLADDDRLGRCRR